MEIKKPTYEELEVEVNRLRKLQKSNIHSNNALENLTNSLTDIVFSVRMPERVIEWCNNSIRAIEYEPDEIIGQTTAFLFTNDENYLDFGNRLQQSIEEGNTVFITEQQFKKKNGETFLADVRVTCDKEDGRIVHATSIIRDITERKQVQNSLFELNQFKSQIINSANEGIIVYDLDMKYREWNPFMANLTALPASEVIGKHPLDVFPFLKDTEVLSNIKKALNGEHTDAVDFPFNIPAGEKKGWTSDETAPLFNSKNEIIGAISTVRNITEQKEIVEDLKHEKKFLEAVLDNIADGIVSCDANGILNRFNQATKEFHGLPDITIAADKWAEHYDIFFPDGKTPMQKKDVPLFRALREGAVQDVEMMIIPKNGKKRLLVTNGKVLNDIDGKTLGAVVAMHDITEQKQVQQDLKESEEKYRALFENAPLSYQSLDKDGRFIDINPSWLRTLGYERNEVIGKNYVDFLHPDWKSHFEKNFPAFKKRGYVKDVEFRIKHKKGHFIDIAFEGCIGYLPDGSFKQTYCVFQDITERKKTEKKLEQSQKRYQSLFDNSPVPLWEEDFSGVKKYIETLQNRNISDFREYFQNNPNEVRECVQLVKIVAINNSVLKLHEAESKEELYNGLSSIFTDSSYDAFIEELITIAEGRLECKFESVTKTLKGNEREVYLKWMVVPGYEDTLEKVYISKIDITERKKAEEKLKEIHENLEELVDERTKELEDKNKLLEKINKAFVGRELKMKELKQEIKSLKEER